MDDRVLRALVRFGVDKKTLAQVKHGTTSVEDALKKMGGEGDKEAEKLKKAFQTVAKSGKYSVKELDKAALELKRSLALLGKSGKYNIEQIGVQSKKTQAILRSFSTALVAMGGAAMLTDFAAQSFVLAGEFERMEKANESLAASLGTTSEAMVEGIQKAAGGTVSKIDALKIANLSLVSGAADNADQLNRMTDAAIKLGRAMGRDATESVTRMTEGIAKQERELLDELGIIVDTNAAYEEYAETLGKGVKELDEFERKQAFTNATLEAAEEKAAMLGESALGRAEKLERLRSSWQDFMVGIGGMADDGGLLDTLNQWVVNLTAGAEAWGGVFDRMAKLKDAAGPGIDSTIEQLKESDNILGNILGKTAELIDNSWFSGAMRLGYGLSGGEGVAENYAEIIQKEEAATEAATKLAQATTETAEAADEAAISQEDYEAALERTTEAMEKLETDSRRKRIDADLKFERKRLDAAEDFAQKRVDLARDNAQRIEGIERAHNQRLADAARQYGRSGQDIDRDYGRQIIDAEKEIANSRIDIEIDYRNRLRDIRRQFELAADEAIREQDAIAYLRAVRSRDEALQDADIQRQDAIAAEQLEAERKREALVEQRKREQEDEKLDYERKLEDLRIQLTRELEEQQNANERKEEELSASEARKKAELDKAHARDLVDLKTHYNRRYVDLKNSLEKEFQLVQQYEAKKRAARSRGVSSAGGANYTGMSASQAAAYGAAFKTRGRASGGYVGRGIYEMGEAGKEFVLNAATTRALEGGLGGQLSQAGIMAALGGAGSRQQTINYNPNYTFNDRDDSRAIVAAINRDVDEKLMRLYRGY